jgi:hypothetical protein
VQVTWILRLTFIVSSFVCRLEEEPIGLNLQATSELDLFDDNATTVDQTPPSCPPAFNGVKSFGWSQVILDGSLVVISSKMKSVEKHCFLFRLSFGG